MGQNQIKSKINSIAHLGRIFFIPSFVLLALATSVLLRWMSVPEFLANGILLCGIAVGSWQLLQDTYQSLLRKSFALDYIAILAIATGLVTGNFLVAGVIVLMMAGGNTLENYAQQRARKSLTSLSNRIPHQVVVITNDNQHKTVPIEAVAIKSTVLVRKGEVVPLDGTLVSKEAVFDESSLTGEPYPVHKQAGDFLRSGVINTGEAVTFRTTVTDQNSTYRKIIKLVEQAQSEKTPFLQLADSLSGWFTLVTLLLALIAYMVSADMNRVLAVLVIATPCPLILAAPIALIGGMNAAARERIIFKRLASLEVLSRVKTMIFDKTGTITFGVPELITIKSLKTGFPTQKLLAVAAGLERHSLHPFARAVLVAAEQKKVKPVAVTNVTEKIGKGLQGEYRGDVFSIQKDVSNHEAVILKKGKTIIGQLVFADVLKPASAEVLRQLQKQGLALQLFTGDTQQRAEALLADLPTGITVKADCSPEDKRAGIAAIKKQGKITAMVGDGINDAPALALADVGIVFSHQEQTAASEAADVILLGGTFQGVLTALSLSQRTMQIAKQSMYLGVGLSLVGMMIAVTGSLPPIAGALTQEIIDVAVILNALRAASNKL